MEIINCRNPRKKTVLLIIKFDYAGREKWLWDVG